jgi:hypothetical protein
MWEMIERMASDRLWIYTGIAGSLFGAAFLMWFKDTRMALWAYSKFDAILDYLVDRWGWTWLQEPEDVWRKRYPRITKKIDELEERLEKIEKTKRK